MTIKQLVTSKHPILNKSIPDVTKFDENLEQLLLDLEDTMYDVEASAICAPQIGVAQKVAMIDMEMDGLLQLINPQIISESDTKVTDLEGSISIPNVYGEVERSKMIVVKSNDKKGNEVEMTAYDDIARMILHMIDHFEGRLFTERVEKFLSESEMEAYFDNE
ncbi:peptide deformylase [Staphylococcus saprophyticus]|jgi:peptide deformylase|uniref:Peptide deformylase-like n=1 Tax=Staphylococcus saprophyticus subsp. saprophyticus (strain ATCC 15305 / DSM 20229 / NCIMB 8711 / NCTC 7292 / S-41) TaxID=342451 RepID=Q49WZ6_STAS1|nr:MULTISPECIES: peptide deformylase [Staphylococcus]CRV21689.1 Peptide deformylase 1 [Streptococcus equi subsp. equi]SIN58426.1 peptide deformylase [Mycobacteroides abscessus subsp. abscessus]AMG20642.1 peptide deformylase [Staphylococcus saprophyticus]AMG33753.1 peptide deformylase [Staphylococcus saprophyticus]ASE59597.1 peptide deformylase [Staphylococcus saprophyticus]